MESPFQFYDRMELRCANLTHPVIVAVDYNVSPEVWTATYVGDVVARATTWQGFEEALFNWTTTHAM
jgi:hypothetical protein